MTNRQAPISAVPSRGESFAATPRWQIAVSAVALTLAALAAYSNTLRAPFVYDDKPSILENSTLHQLGTALSPPGGGITVDGRPLLNLTFAVNYALGGLNPWGYHALNLLVHVERRPGLRFVSEVLEIAGYSPNADHYDLKRVFVREEGQ